MLRHIPNIITLGNLFCGSLAVVFAVNGNIRDAASLILLGAFLDFFDGFAARLLNVGNEMGKQLDSLADMVSFGLAPGLIAFDILKNAIASEGGELPWMAYIAFMIVLFSALRLAKFNIDERQVDDFIGMPTPANALFWLSIGLSIHYYPDAFLAHLFANSWVVIASIILLSLILVSEIPVFSLKIKSFGIKGNEWKIILLVISIILLVLLFIQAVPLIIILYLILSLIKNQVSSSKEDKLIA